MAQVVGGSNYDFQWDRRLDYAIRAIREIADYCCIRTIEEISSDKFLAVIIRIFSGVEISPEIDVSKITIRKLDEWLLVVNTLKDELKLLKENSTAGQITEVEDILLRQFQKVITDWTKGDSENPPTLEALESIISILFKHHFIKNPAKPNKKYIY